MPRADHYRVCLYRCVHTFVSVTSTCSYPLRQNLHCERDVTLTLSQHMFPNGLSVSGYDTHPITAHRITQGRLCYTPHRHGRPVREGATYMCWTAINRMCWTSINNTSFIDPLHVHHPPAILSVHHNPITPRATRTRGHVPTRSHLRAVRVGPGRVRNTVREHLVGSALLPLILPVY